MSFYLNILDRLTISAPNPPIEVRHFILKQLRLFSVAILDKPTKIDIELTACIADDDFPQPDSVLTEQRGYQISTSQNHPMVMIQYKNNVDIVLIYNQGIKIFYRSRPRISRRLYGLLLFSLRLLLMSQQALLMHGSAVTRADQNLLIFAPNGTGKTRLLLTLLDDGWDYLADDKFILHNNHVHVFQDFIAVREQHLDLINWPLALWNTKRRLEFGSGLRDVLRKTVKTTIHHKLASPILARLNRRELVPVNDLFPKIQIASALKPTTVVLLYPTGRPGSESMSTQSGLVALSQLQELAFHEFGELYRLLLFYNAIPHSELAEILQLNLGHVSFIRVNTPTHADPKSTYQEILPCLAPA